MKPKSFLAKSIATLIATTVTLTSALHALPQGAQVQSGTANFSHSGGALNIQTSDRAIINYQSFSIGGAERVNFIQPSTLSLTLNRVTAPNPSQIFGTLTSNGKIVIANPYGIYFGPNSVINVGGIIAGAGHISDSDFLAGKMNFSNLSGDVENRGRITAVTDVGLYGAHVSNEGVITSQKGSVTLAAGSNVFVGEAGGNIFVGTAPAAIPKARVVSKPAVSNSGQISGPKVSLVAGDMYGMAIAQSGAIISGDITISAGKGGTADVSGRLDASNRAAGKTGGSVKITGEKVALRGAKINASGSSGGGTILVGGDYQGSGTTPRAKTTSVDAASKLSADAITRGNGGRVIVWSDDATLFAGSISAKGGAIGGDGGFIETSGKLHLEVSPSASVDATAANGRGGIWLLDPNNLSITNAADANVTAVTPFTTTNDNAVLSTLPAGNLITALNAGTSVVVQTASAGTNAQLGNISVDASVIWTTAATLTLNAANNITINQPITATVGSGSLTLNANTAATGAISNAVTGFISLGTGTLTANSGTGGISLGNAAVSAGTVNFTSTGAVTVNNAANAISNVASVASTAGGNVSVRTVSALAIGAGGINAGANTVSLTTTGAALAITQNATGVITAGTLSLATTNGAATLNTATNSVTNLGTVALGSGALNLLNSGPMTVSGAVGATGGVTLNTSGALTVNNTVNAGVGNVSLTTTGAGNAITQTGVITAGTLFLATANASATLNGATNAVTNLGAVTLGTGALDLLDSGGLTVTGAVAATGGVTVNTSGALVVNSTVNAGAGNVSLTTTGAGNAITQNATGVITAATLSLGTANAAATLNTTTNAVTNLGAVTLGSGALNLLDGGGLIVTGAVGATGGVTLNTSGALTVNNTVNAGGGNVSLTTTGAGNAITQNATGVVTAGTLSLATADAAATLDTATNAVTNLGAVTLGTGALNLLDAGGLTVTGAVAATGGVTLSTGGVLAVNSTINATGATVSLTTTGAGNAITQTGAITAGTLNLTTTNAGAALNGATNVVGAIGTVSLGNGIFFLMDNAAAGLTLPGATLTAGGLDITNTTGNLTITGTLTAAGSSIVLNAPAANATISQVAGAVMGATTGITLTTGTVALAGGAVGTIGAPIAFAAGQTAVSVTTHGGSVFLTDALGSLGVTSVITTGIPNAVGGGVNISTTLAGSALTVGTITTTGGTAPASTDGLMGGNLTLSSAGSLAMGAITTSGGAATGPGNHNGGVAGTISLTAQVGTTINVNGSINVAGGAGSGGGGNPGMGQSLTFNNDVVTGNALTLSGSTITFNARLSPGGDATATALAVNGSLTFGAGATLFATLNGTTAGTTFDQITVSGGTSLITLNNSVLTSASLASFNVGDAVRIINTSGGASLNAPTQFAAGAVITIDGQKFNITYNTGGTDHVTLTRAQSLWTWDGRKNNNTDSGDNNWTNSQNWTFDSGSPGTGDVVHFSSPFVASRLAPLNNNVGLSIESITFDAGAGLFVLGGNGLTIGSGITNNSTNIETVNMPLTLGAAQTFNAASGPIAFGASSSVSGSFALTLNGGFNIGSGGARMTTSVLSIVDNMTAGTAFIAQTGALNLSGGFAGANLDLTNAGAITVNAALNAGGGTISLATTGGAANTITQGATGVITAATLNLATAGADATLNTATNSVANLGTTALGAGALNLLNAGGLTVTGAVGATGGVTLNAGGALAINNTLNAGGGNVSLTTTGAGNAITQNATGVITGGTLTLATANADATLNAATNVVTNLGAVTLGTGTLNLLDAGGLTVTGAVGATGGVTLNTSGALAVNNVLNAGAGTVSLTTTGAGNAITQNATGVITAGTLNLVTSGGSTTLNTATNVVTNLGTVTLGAGSFSFSDNAPAGLAVGPTTANGGIDITNTTGSLSTGAALTADGNISLRSVTGTLTLGGAVTSNNGGVTLRSNGALNTGAFLVSAPTAVTGDVTLISDTSTVTIGAGGVTVGDTLTIQIGAALTLTTTGAITAPNVTFIADDMSIGAAINSTGTITLAPVTVGTNVTLGNAAPALVGLVIDNTELGFLNSASVLTIGKNGGNPTTAQAIRFGTATVGNPTLNLNALAGIDQNAGPVSIGGGTGTLNIAAGGAVNLVAPGVNIGVLGGGTTNGAFDVNGISVAGLTVNAITNTGGEVVIINNSGPITVSGAINSNGQAVAVSTLGGLVSINAPITAAGASVGLNGSGGVTQSGAGIITAANLLAQTQGAAATNVTLTSNNVVSGNVTLNAGGGSVTFQDTSAFNVGGLASIVYPVTGTLTANVGSGIRTAAGGTASITTGGNVTQSAGATNIVSTGTLNVARLGAANPAVALNNAANAVANVGTVALNTGSFTLANGTNLNIGGAGTAGGGYSVNTAGTLTQLAGATIDTSASNGTIALTTTGGAANAITLNDVLNAGAGMVNLNSTGSVTQAAGNILAGAVTANSGAAGSVTLNAGTNAFASITGTGGTGGFAVTDSQGLTVAAGGVTTGGGTLALTATGVTSDITVANPLAANGAANVITLTAGRDILLNSTATATGGTVNLLASRNVTESGTGGVAAVNLRAVGTTGAVTMTAGAANNSVATIAGTANGNFSYTDGLSAALAIGTVTTVGVTSTTGTVSVLANAGTLTVSNAVQGNGAVTLASNGAQTIAATVTSTTAGVTATATNGALAVNQAVSATAGTVALTTTGAGNAITQNGIGVITGDTLTLTTTNANATLNAATNAVANLGAVSLGSGALNLLDAGGLTVTGVVGATGGVTLNTSGTLAIDNALNAGGGNVSLATTGAGNAITQNGIGVITGDTLTLTTTNANATLNAATNAVANLGAVSLGSGALNLLDAGGLTVTGVVGATGGVTLNTSGALAIDNALNAGGGNVSLTTTGAGNAITQNGIGVITGDTLTLTTTDANATLNAATNAVANLGAVSLGSGALNLLDAGGLTVTGVVGATGGVALNTSGTLAIDNAVNAGGGNVSLTASVGNITQSGAGVLSGALLSATASTGSVLLDTLANGFATFTANATGAGQAVRYRDTDAFVVAASGILTDAATGVVVLQSQNAAGTASGAITQTGEILGGQLAVRAAQPGGSATLTNVLNTPSLVAANVAGNFLYTNANPAGLQVGTVDGVLGITTPDAVTLTALQGNLTQTQAIVGPASSVSATSTLGAVDLTNAGNAFAALTGSSALNFSAVDSVALTVGAGGITANGGNVVSLTVNGAGNSLSLAGVVTGGTVNLFANTDITQTAAGGVVAPNLQVVATNGLVNLATGATNNNVGTIAGRANLDFTYVDNNSPALSVGTVTTVGVTSTTGDVVITAVNGSLAVNQNVNAIALGGDVTLQSQNNLTLNAAVSASPVNGVVGLTSVAGSIIENPGGTVSSSQLRANAAINVDLAQLNSAGSNGFAARGTTGFVAFVNTGPILLDQVGATIGVSAGSAVVLLNTAGDITQTVNGIITTGTGLLMQSLAGSITLDRANLVTGNFAVVGTTAGDITLRNTGLINIGAVGPFATAVPIGTFSGIGGGVTRFLSLTSDTGVITQDAGALDRIITGDLRVQTTGMNATLTNAANEIASVGTVALGAGAFRLVDSTLGLIVNGDVTANGGVDIRTAGGALSVTALPGTVNANAGNILLRSADSDVLLAGVLTASGLVQLDAGGAITQAGTGSIAGLSLIARAAGNVTLNQAANDVTNLAGSSATGTFSYRDATAITVATVDDATTPVAVPVVGITTANRDITVVGGAGNVALSAALNAGAGTVRLQNNAGNVTQTAPITAANLLANAFGGSVNLGHAGNAIALNVAGTTTGANSSFRFRNSGAIMVANVVADAITGPLPANGITTNNGDVAILAGGAITLTNRINAANGAATAGIGSGVVRLQADTGNVTQAPAGIVVANSLLVNAADVTSGVMLDAANDVITIAGKSGTGGFSFQGPTGFTFDTVAADGSVAPRADGSAATPGLLPPLTIGALTGVMTTGPLILNSAGTINFAVQLMLGGSLNVTAMLIDINGGIGGGLPSIQTVGGQTYNGPVVLTADAVLVDTAGGAIRFLGAGSTVNSESPGPFRALTITTSGTTQFDGAAGNTGALASLTRNGGGTTAVNGGLVNTTGLQLFSDDVTLGAVTTQFTSTGNATVTFGGTLNGASDTTVTTGGLTTFTGAVGNAAALASLTSNGGGTTAVNGGLVNTTGLQLFGDDVTLGAAATQFTSTGNAAVTFGGTLNGASDTTVTTGGLTTFTGAVGGATALTSLTRNGGGTTAVNGGLVNTTGLQLFSDDVTLGAVTTQFTSTGNATVTFGGTLNGASDTTVTTGGLTTFTGAVGNAAALASLTSNGGGTTAVNGGLVNTTGLQLFGDDVTLGAAATQFTSTGNAAVTFGGTLNGASDTTVTTGGLTTFTGAVGGATALTSLTRNGGGTTAVNGGLVNTTGLQLFSDDVTLGAVTTQFTSTGNATVTFGGTLNGASDTTVTTGGLTTFTGAVGNAAALASLTSNGGGTTAVNGGLVNTTGLQLFGDDVTLGAAATQFTSTGNATVTFSGTLNGASATAVTTGGLTTFTGPVGGATALTSLTSNGGGTSAVNGGLVRTTGLQLFSDDVTMGAAVTQFTSTGNAAVTFSGTLNGASDTTVTTGGLTTFTGAVGGGTALTSLTSNSGGTSAVNGGLVRTTGLQLFSDDVTMGAATTQFTSTGNAAVTFSGTLSGASATTVTTGGATTFTGAVGLPTALTSLTTDGPGTVAINGGQVRTTGAQTYGDAATLGANTVLTSTGGGTLMFQNTLNGARTLQVNTTGNEVFNGVVGGIAALTSLTTDALLLGGQTQFNMDVALAPAGRAGVNVTGKVTVNDAVVFNAANSSDVAPTIRTGGGQEFSSVLASAATLTQDVVLTDTGAQPVLFSGPLNGPRGISVNTAGFTTFTGDIGATTPIAFVTTDALGTTVLPRFVTTTGDQNFNDLVTLSADTTLRSTTLGALNLFNEVDAANHSLTLITAGTARLGRTISRLTALDPRVTGVTTLGTDATSMSIIPTVPGRLVFNGPVAVRGDVTIMAGSKGASRQTVNFGQPVRFNNAVNGPGSLTVTSRGPLTLAGGVGLVTPLAALVAKAPIIHLSNTRTVGTLRVDALNTIASSTDNSDGLVNLTGNSYVSLAGNVEFNPTGRSPVSKHATILSNAGNLSISAAGNFFMGNEQKLLVNNGSLTVSAGSTATVGDMAASVSMKLTASSVVFQGRQLNGFFNSNREDHGLGFVSPTIRFDSSSVSFAPGTNRVVVFSTRDSIASVRQIAGLSLEIDKDIAMQFNKQDLKLGPAPLFLPEVPNVIFGTVQPIASGTRVTEPGQIQVTFVLEIPKLVELPQDTFLSTSDKDILKRMGIYPRDATSDENITVSLKRGVFSQPIEGKAEMEDPEYAVVVNRLTTEEVQKIIRAYIAVAGKNPADIDKMANLLNDQVIKFHTQVPDAKGLDGFTKWLQENRATDKAADELARNLDELSSVFVQLSQVGLTKKEVAICKAKICLALDKAGLGSAEIATLVEGAAKLPPQAPRPAVTAPPPMPPVDVPPAGGVPAPVSPEPLPPALEPGAPAPDGAAATPSPAPNAPAEPKAQ